MHTIHQDLQNHFLKLFSIEEGKEYRVGDLLKIWDDTNLLPVTMKDKAVNWGAFSPSNPLDNNTLELLLDLNEKQIKEIEYLRTCLDNVYVMDHLMIYSRGSLKTTQIEMRGRRSKNGNVGKETENIFTWKFDAHPEKTDPFFGTETTEVELEW